VVGLHVHPGLQPEADAWVKHLQAQSRRWTARGLPVSLQWQRLQGAPAAGDSIEAWARRGRYEALAEMARECGAGTVLLAHHRRDQAETFVLQALRGAGPAGLAAMPREAQRGGIIWVRPWLEQPREAIDAYLRRHRLSFVDDPSNADRRLARNRLRHELWPALAHGFEHAETSLVASALRAQEAAACLRELAQIDASPDGSLHLSTWSQLSAARRANLLRSWLAGQTHAGVPETLVQRLLRELPEAANASAWPWPGGELRLHAGQLQVVHNAETPFAPKPQAIDLSREGRFNVPAWRGSFEVRVVDSAGLAPQRLRRCELRARSGGERFQRASGTPPRSLKKQFQDAGVPAWQRDGPLLYVEQDLLFVPGLGVDARQQAPSGTPMLGLLWLPEAPGADG
jgi:tRNA(Ile)-lysidine synthase